MLRPQLTPPRRGPPTALPTTSPLTHLLAVWPSLQQNPEREGYCTIVGPYPLSPHTQGPVLTEGLYLTRRKVFADEIHPPHSLSYASNSGELVRLSHQARRGETPMRNPVVWFGVTLLTFPAACNHDITGLIMLASTYSLHSIDGSRLPVHSFRSVTNAAGSCVYDIVDGLLTFDGSGAYSTGFRYDVRCAGQLPTIAHDDSQGSYTHRDAIVDFSPRAATTFTLSRATVHSTGLTLVLRMNAGDQYDLRFVPVQIH